MRIRIAKIHLADGTNSNYRKTLCGLIRKNDGAYSEIIDEITCSRCLVIKIPKEERMTKALDSGLASGSRTCLIQVTTLDKERIDKLAVQLNIASLVVIRHALDIFSKSLKDAGFNG